MVKPRLTMGRGSSSIAATTKHMFGMGTVTGKFALVSGQIVITEPVSSSRAEAAASARSFDSASPMRDGQVKSAKFLDAEAHPETRFTSTELVRDGDRWLLRGKSPLAAPRHLSS